MAMPSAAWKDRRVEADAVPVVTVGADPAPRQFGPRVRRDEKQDHSQYGLVTIALSRSYLAGVVRGPLAPIAERLNLRLEQSFNEAFDCNVAYLETMQDAFTLVEWEPDRSVGVEVWAHVDPQSAQPARYAQPEFNRFIALAQIEPGDVLTSTDPEPTLVSGFDEVHDEADDPQFAVFFYGDDLFRAVGAGGPADWPRRLRAAADEIEQKRSQHRRGSAISD
jgi:hypothetical protein